MEDQLTLMNAMDIRFKTGDEIEGQILSILNDEIIVSLIGYKSDGVIPFKELTIEDNLSKILASLKVGDSIRAKVVKLKNEDNYVVLSRLEYEKQTTLAVLKEYFERKEEFSVLIKDGNDKGLVAYYQGVRIFIPISQVDTKFIKNYSDYIGKELVVRIIDFLTGNMPKVVASRRVLLDEENSKIENEVWGSLNLGDVINVEVRRFTKFGAFAEYRGVDGLLHLSQISWKHIQSVDEILSIGQKIDVKIINLDKENKKLSFSLKEMTAEPWITVDEKYPVGSVVLGKVVRINDFGAFVELEPGLDGLVHISKLSHNHVKHPSEVLTINDDVKCIILDVNKENRRLSLSIKDAE